VPDKIPSRGQMKRFVTVLFSLGWVRWVFSHIAGAFGPFGRLAGDIGTAPAIT